MSTDSKISWKSPLRYPGGKQKAIEQIARMLPAFAREYREPMIGGGSVFIHARSIGLAQSYWINDKFKELISFWTTVQDSDSCALLCKDLHSLLAGFSSPEEIKSYYLKARELQPINAYQEALLFFFFNRVTFSGTTKAGGFSSAASLKRFTASSIERIKPLTRALAGVKITNEDFQPVIETPGDDVFIFLDPPYFGANKLYGENGNLHVFDHQRLAQLLRSTQHRFLITYDDRREIRQLYRWANVSKWHLQYGMNNCSTDRASKIGKELFISNY